MLIIGLTGSIGMGKSTAAKVFREHGIAVFDADAEVHRLYEGPAVDAIGRLFPQAIVEGRVDRARLAEALADDSAAFAKVEAVVHPMVREAERAFLVREAEKGAAMAVLDIPLLFETGGDRLVDVVVVVSAPEEIQRKRVLARGQMTAEKLERILERQMPDAEKRARADFVVDTGGPVERSAAEIGKIIEALKGRRGTAYARHWAG